MTTKYRISKSPPTEPVLNYEYLRKAGLKYIEELSHKVWTDYNIHDPGITILELLCYAITDLGYRTSYPIADILADKEENLQNMNKQFLSAIRILPSGPVTINDYRKLLLDIPGIKNAWLRESTETTYYVDCVESSLSRNPHPRESPYGKITLKGLYEAVVELEEESGRSEESIIEAAWKRLHENRNLCEDFSTIRIVKKEGFSICAEIELAPDAEIDSVGKAVISKVRKYLTPSVKFHSLREMIDKGMAPDEIFEGPVLDNGFIDNDELEEAELRERINLSDIIRVIMNIKGVLAVRDIKFSPSDPSPGAPDKWTIKVKKDHRPVLNLKKSRIIFYKEELPFKADIESAASNEEPGGEDTAGTEPPKIEDLPIQTGEDRKIGQYYSFQNHFPFNYGIGGEGLQDSASETRKAQAKQLKAYLLFFDQLLANYFAQLAHVKELFSLDENIGRTCFTQVISTVRGEEDLYVDYEGIEARIQELAEDESRFVKRRNRFLDHLLARFAESFNEYAWIMYSSGLDQTRRDMIKTKIGFLRDYPSISSLRGQAFDYTDQENLWDTYSVTGLERRVARLLGIRNYKRRNLFNIKYEVYQEKDRDNIDEYRFRVIDEKGKILLSSSAKYGDKESAVREMRRALGFATGKSGYDRKETSDGRFYFNIIDDTGEVLARRIEYFDTEQEREAAVEYLLDFLIRKYSDEGFFVIEHILLRPETDKEPFFPIKVSPDCSDCYNSDPYSFRITIVLPAWSARFSRIDFRRFVEKTLRIETPSHIQPRICWVDEEQMGRFEKAYRQWLEYNAAGRDKERVTDRLISVLCRMKSVYPEAIMYDCSAMEAAKEAFILDTTNLGTQKE